MQRWLVTCKKLLHGAVRRPWLLYGLLALGVLAPLLRPGYIVTLDMVFTPTLRMPTSIGNDYVFRVLLHLLNILLPSDLIEKIILFAALLLSGVGMHRLVQYVNRKPANPYSILGAYAGGVLYVINPFTYDRFMAGQYEVLLGYALLPWFVRQLLGFLAKPEWRHLFGLIMVSTSIGILSIHDIGLMAILATVALCVALWQQRADRAWQRKTVRLGLAGVGVWLLASSYWIIPLMLGKGTVAAQIAGISTHDQSAFATVGGGALGRIGNIVRLQGFWAEARGMYQLPQTHVHAWGLIGLLVWALAIAGGVSLWRTRQRAVVAVLGVSGCIGALLAAGVLNVWLAAHIPLLAGYREPEKFVALIALAYALFMARGAAAMVAYCHENGDKIFAALVAGAVLITPLVWTSTMLYGFGGQLRPVEYPTDWLTVNARLKSDPSDFKTLFLPWHLYMRFNFAGRIIANPATNYFDKPVIVSDNPEFNGAALSNTTAAKRTLDHLLPGAERQGDFGARLAALHIKYIIVDHDDNNQDAADLADRADMQLLVHGSTLDLYRNKAYRNI